MKFFTLRSYFSEITELEVMNDQCHTSARRRTEIPLCLGPRCLSIPAADRLPRLFSRREEHRASRSCAGTPSHAAVERCQYRAIAV